MTNLCAWCFQEVEIKSHMYSDVKGNVFCGLDCQLNFSGMEDEHPFFSPAINYEDDNARCPYTLED